MMEERTDTAIDAEAAEAAALPAAELDIEAAPPMIAQQTLAQWRAALARLRTEERQQFRQIPEETGRLLEIVGQALAQGGGSLPPADIARIEEVTRIDVAYR